MCLYLDHDMQWLCNLAVFAAGRQRQKPRSRVTAEYCRVVVIRAQRLFAVSCVGGTHHLKERSILNNIVKGPLGVEDFVPAVF